MASLKASEIKDRLKEEGFETPDGLAPVAVHEDFKKSSEAGLVILAMGEAYWTLVHGDVYVLCVHDARAQVIREELEACALLESKKAVVEHSCYQEFQFGWGSFLAYLFLVIGIFSVQARYGLTDLGRVDSLAICNAAEWWRCVTALTLHADVVHLVSNLVAGMGFAFFVARFFGATAGWGLILLSGAGGNLLNAWVYYPSSHFSIGASTAVFGAVGLLTGIGVCVALTEPQQRWTLPRWLVPVFGGFTLLGLIGVGDGLVDVAAHISGFLCGFVFGLIGTVFQSIFVCLQRQRIWVAGSIFACLATAWWLAFSAA
ncbi:MAG TPA: hypothetical protein DCX06_07440 [Opitutae bacterium]|nr:hypothetical protein [Opitutae bacterium]